MLYIAASKVFWGPADSNSMKTKIKSIHRLESGRNIVIPAGLPVVRADNLSSTSLIKYWLADCPPKADDEIECHLRTVGFGFRADEVDAPSLVQHYENRPII